jgi:D-amino peptidase
MKIYISVDMEGVGGVWHGDQCTKGAREYEAARRLLTAEVAAAVEGAREAGADEIIVADMHGGSGHLVFEELPAGIKTLVGVPHEPRFPFLDQSVDAMFLIGYHAMAGTRGAVMPHTMTIAWQEFRVNGRVLGEVGIDAGIAGCVGVPVILVTGDDKVGAEARALLGDIETAEVKRGVERERALFMSPAEAQALVRTKAAAAVRRIGEMKPFDAGSPAVIELRFALASDADAAERSGVERVDRFTVRWTLPNIGAHFGGLWRPD